MLTEEAIRYLAGLVEQRPVHTEGLDFHLVHATPCDPLYEYLAGGADESIWRAAVGDLAEREAWLFVGHTHRPFVRRIGRLIVVNPGSLGMPIDGDPRACSAVWEDSEVTLKRIEYDVSAP